MILFLFQTQDIKKKKSSKPFIQGNVMNEWQNNEGKKPKTPEHRQINSLSRILFILGWYIEPNVM